MEIFRFLEQRTGGWMRSFIKDDRRTRLNKKGFS